MSVKECYSLGKGESLIGTTVRRNAQGEDVHILKIGKLITKNNVQNPVTMTLIGVENKDGLDALNRAVKRLKDNFYSSCYGGA